MRRRSPHAPSKKSSNKISKREFLTHRWTVDASATLAFALANSQAPPRPCLLRGLFRCKTDRPIRAQSYKKIRRGSALMLPKANGYRKQKRAIRESPLRETIKFIVGATSGRPSCFISSSTLFCTKCVCCILGTSNDG